MRRIFIIGAILFLTKANFAQTEMDRMYMTGSLTGGLNSILGGYSTGIFSNTIYSAGTIGLRKNISEKFKFLGVEIGYAQRGIRINRYWGNPILPERGNSYKNRYASFQFFIGKYLGNTSYVKGIAAMEYLFSSDQYDFKNISYYRSVNRITPSLEFAWGKNTKNTSSFRGYLELTAGILLLRPNFFHVGLRGGFFLGDKSSESRTY